MPRNFHLRMSSKPVLFANKKCKDRHFSSPQVYPQVVPKPCKPRVIREIGSHSEAFDDSFIVIIIITTRRIPRCCASSFARRATSSHTRHQAVTPARRLRCDVLGGAHRDDCSLHHGACPPSRDQGAASCLRFGSRGRRRLGRRRSDRSGDRPLGATLPARSFSAHRSRDRRACVLR